MSDDKDQNKLSIPPSEIKLNSHDTDVLGRGSHGFVYRCYHESCGAVAMKLFDLYGSSSSYKNIRQDVANELNIMRRLQGSQQVIGVYGITELYICKLGIVMEYLPRGSLSDLIMDTAKLLLKQDTWPLMLRIMHETAAGLAYLHRRDAFDHRVTHNDLKPQNILLDINFRAKLCDFGGSNVAAISSNNGNAVSVSPTAASRVHTANYAAPEFLKEKDGSPLVSRTRAMDVYSYGMTLHFVLAKRHPFCTLESIQIKQKATNEEPPKIDMDKIMGAAKNTQDKEIINLLARKMDQCSQFEFRERPKIAVVEADLLIKMRDDEMEDGIEKVVKNLQDLIPLREEGVASERRSLEDVFGARRPEARERVIQHQPVMLDAPDADLQKGDSFRVKTPRGLAKCVVEHFTTNPSAE